MDGDERYWIIYNPDDVALPEKEGISRLLPIVDEKYGGVIAWANTEEQAIRIVKALEKEVVLDG